MEAEPFKIQHQMASTHRQIILNEADDNVRADEDSRASDAGAAVHCDWSLVVHGPQVADEANQLLGAVRHAVVGPVCELQVVDVMTLTCLLKQIKLKSFRVINLAFGFIYYSSNNTINNRKCA